MTPLLLPKQVAINGDSSQLEFMKCSARTLRVPQSLALDSSLTITL